MPFLIFAQSTKLCGGKNRNVPNSKAGREFVAAYVEFVHYVEHLDKIAKKEISSHHEEAHEMEGYHKH